MNSAEILLTRKGLLGVAPDYHKLDDHILRALDLEVAELGYSLSFRLSERLRSLPTSKLTEVKEWLVTTLSCHLGANLKHEPLFRQFPEGIPENTFELWLKKIGIYFFQAEGQSCLFCRSIGTTHVLNPCGHVICDKCFDGSSYSACPACEHHVDKNSPFFTSSNDNQLRSDLERPRFKLIDLTEDVELAVQNLFVSFCLRKQALSPSDLETFNVIIKEYRSKVLQWLPQNIPVKENIATIFGHLLKECDIGETLSNGQSYLKTATDFLRLIAVYSGADVSLQQQTVWKKSPRTEDKNAASMWSQLIKRFRTDSTASVSTPPTPRLVAVSISRFKVGRLSRKLRRGVLGALNKFPFQNLAEDMLRHQSYWVWLSEFLHPFEYSSQYPRAALAFAIVHNTKLHNDKVGTILREAAKELRIEVTDDGIIKFRTYCSHLEEIVQTNKAEEFLSLLKDRPGEFARRLDHCLRLFIKNKCPVDSVLSAFADCASDLSTPTLLTITCQFSKRNAALPVRLFFPKGQVTKGMALPDTRLLFSEELVTSLVELGERELLKRFLAKTPFRVSILDESLRSIAVPFNERTASKSLVAVPRGSTLNVPSGKVVRLFLHWCQPRNSKHSTDLDLSVGFYDSSWQYKGICSYYELRLSGQTSNDIALSAGDLRDAPFPDGASEFIDVDRDSALAEGFRYAVMVVTNYAGQPFESLERGFAGIMLRDDVGGKHFDARTVDLKFDLQGSNGVFLPLVLDIKKNTLHWLDANKKGQFQFNSVATSNSAIQKLCPSMIDYFGSGARPFMFQLAALHAASRSSTVYVRGASFLKFERGESESTHEFYKRIMSGDSDVTHPELPELKSPVFAALMRGDIVFSATDTAYTLYRDKLTNVVSASDLLS